MDEKRNHKWSVLPFVCVLLVPVLYVLSYAPYVRFKYGADRLTPFLSYPPADEPAYKPVEWMIDDTPLRIPLLKWAEIWDVRFFVETGSASRNSPPAFYLSPKARSIERNLGISGP